MRYFINLTPPNGDYQKPTCSLNTEHQPNSRPRFDIPERLNSVVKPSPKASKSFKQTFINRGAYFIKKVIQTFF